MSNSLLGLIHVDSEREEDGVLKLDESESERSEQVYVQVLIGDKWMIRTVH